MSTSPVYGFQGQLGIDTATPVTRRFDFQSSTLGLEEEFKDTNGLRGTRARSVERVRAGTRLVDGQIRLQPTAVELSEILAWIMGGTPTGSPAVSYPLADALSSRFVVIDKAAKVMTYSGVMVDTWRVRGSQGEPLDMELELVGQDETEGNAGTFPSLSLDLTNTPFMFQDMALSINSVTYFAKSFAVTLNNSLDRARFYNSQTLTAIVAMDRHVTLNCELPAGDAMAVYGAGAAGLPVTATFTNGGAILTLTFPKVCFPRKPIQVARPEIMVPMQGTAYKSGSTLEFACVLNPGP